VPRTSSPTTRFRPRDTFLLLNTMHVHGLSLLFLVWPLITNAVTLPTSVREATTLLKVPILSKLVPNLASILELRSNAPTQTAVLKVVTSVQCGNDQTFEDVLIDTGSAILWVGGQDPYVPGPNTEVINSTFGIGYGIGAAEGIAYRDTVVIGEATGPLQFIGAANQTNGFNLVEPIDGILGLGPSGSNYGEISGFNFTPTFVETLFNQNQISELIFGIYIAPLGADGTPTGTGEITFEAIDQSKIQGEVTWVPQNEPVNFHWEFNVSSFNFGPVNLTNPTEARTDTGVLSIGIPFDSFFDILHVYNGSIPTDNSAISGSLSFNSNIVPSLPSLDITIGSEIFCIPPSRYIVPHELYPILNVTDTPGLERTWIESAGPGEFGLGQKWLENFYTAYDLEQHRIGFAHNNDDSGMC